MLMPFIVSLFVCIALLTGCADIKEFFAVKVNVHSVPPGAICVVDEVNKVVLTPGVVSLYKDDCRDLTLICSKEGYEQTRAMIKHVEYYSLESNGIRRSNEINDLPDMTWRKRCTYDSNAIIYLKEKKKYEASVKSRKTKSEE